MAHIPFGYRIEMGKAVPDEEQVEKLNVFLEGYLGGLSIDSARRVAGIELSRSALLDYMRSGTFAGTEYYPPIVASGMKERILEELEKRTFKGTSIFVPPVPVRTEFKMRTVEPTGTAAEKAAARYAAIEVVEEHTSPLGNSSTVAGHIETVQKAYAKNACEKGA